MVMGEEHKFGTDCESYYLGNTPPTWLHESKFNLARCSICLVITRWSNKLFIEWLARHKYYREALMPDREMLILNTCPAQVKVPFVAWTIEIFVFPPFISVNEIVYKQWAKEVIFNFLTWTLIVKRSLLADFRIWQLGPFGSITCRAKLCETPTFLFPCLSIKKHFGKVWRGSLVRISNAAVFTVNRQFVLFSNSASVCASHGPIKGSIFTTHARILNFIFMACILIPRCDSLGL